MFRATAKRRSIRASVKDVFNFLAILLVFAGLAGGVARAQLSGKGEIKGTVKDPSGAVVTNATVTATEVSTGVSATRSSNASGLYDISPLDAGVYMVTVTAKGFEKLTQANVHVNALEISDYDPVLTVGSSSETVTVSTLPPQLETSNAVLGATMEQEMYSALPIEMDAYGQADQRRATDYAFLMPGVQGNNTTGNPTTNTGIVNGSGSKGAVSDVYIDGIPFVRAGGNGDPRYVWTAISVDAVDQFQVQTSGYSAIYEGQGLQNYTVKQGGNAYHGSIYEFFRNTSLDTWGFFGSVPNPITGVPVKPIEHNNEYGINLGGPLVPLPGWKDKLFFYGNYSGFRYASATPTQMTFPTAAEQSGDFSATGVNIYDPSTQTACTAKSTNGPCRYQFGYVGGAGTGAAGNPVLGPLGAAGVNKIPSTEFSSVAQAMQAFLPATGISTALQNNYIAPNRTGLSNWSTTDRIDYMINTKDTLTMVAAIGRQASSVPVGQTTAGRDVGPLPYNFGQAYAPKTAVGILEETHVFSPNIVNQLKFGYARYNGPTFNADEGSAYAATAMGLSGLPAGQAQQAFPFVTWAGTDAPTNWAGEPASVTVAENYTLLDNLQWVKGNHTLTIGGQTAWLLYNVINDTGGTSPITLATAVTETAGITASSNSAPKYAAAPSTGLSYASFLVGQIDKGSFTQYVQQEFGARFRAISPYVQDNWKVNSKLTLDIGLRYDFFPTVTEVHNAESFFDPNLANPVSGGNGALNFTGSGANTCNCSTPVNNYMKNWGPRLGLAYQVKPKTVIHASYGVMYTHGNAVGGSATSLGTLGFSTAPSFSANGSLLSTIPLTGTNGAIPTYSSACGVASGPAFGTGYTTNASYTTVGCGTASYTGTPSSMGYLDPYVGGRAPEFINWSVGVQQQWTQAFTTTVTYVGSQGHFLPTDGGNPRGYWSDQLDPKYLSLGSGLTALATAANCTANNITCPANFTTSQAISAALKPFPFQTVSDTFGYVANANYNALQVTGNMRASHGVTFMASYTWSRSIDDGGTFRTGYPIPAGTIVNEPNTSLAADRIERSVSTSNQPQHLVITGVWDLPIGKSVLAKNAVERAVLGGFKFSEIFQDFSGSPLAITGSACQTNPADITCEPTLNPAFSGPVRVQGKWGKGITAANTGAITYIAPSIGSTTITPTGPFIAPAAPTCTNGVLVNTNGVTCPSGSVGATLMGTTTVPNYTFGNSPRTAPYDLSGPGNYQLDIALVRSFPLHLSEASKFDFRAEMYNVTNHTLFGVASAAVGNASFGQVTTNSNYNRRAVQLSARIEF
jgi:hypothetical protein